MQAIRDSLGHLDLRRLGLALEATLGPRLGAEARFTGVQRGHAALGYSGGWV